MKAVASKCIVKKVTCSTRYYCENRYETVEATEYHRPICNTSQVYRMEEALESHSDCKESKRYSSIDALHEVA